MSVYLGNDGQVIKLSQHKPTSECTSMRIQVDAGF